MHLFPHSIVHDLFPESNNVLPVIYLYTFQFGNRDLLALIDDTGTTAFLGFDTEVAKLTHVLASQAAQIVRIGANAQVDMELSRSLADLVGLQFYSKPPNLYDFLHFSCT
ncbi:hypothetical protein YC2023_107615 [Brassica napus]